MKVDESAVLIALANKGMTKSEMAAKAGLSRQSVCRILRNGNCEPRTAGKIARALEVDVEELIAKEA